MSEDAVLLADLARRVAELERAWLVGDADRELGLADIVPAIRRAVPSRVRTKGFPAFGYLRVIREQLDRNAAGGLVLGPADEATP